MGSIFSPSIPKPKPAPPAPTPTDPMVQQIAEAQAAQAASAAGRMSTILTGGLGDTSAAPVVQKQLLGY